jgi:hypothetical protein
VPRSVVVLERFRELMNQVCHENHISLRPKETFQNRVLAHMNLK